MIKKIRLFKAKGLIVILFIFIKQHEFDEIKFSLLFKKFYFKMNKITKKIYFYNSIL